MRAESRSVTSSQQGLHQKLTNVVRKHMSHVWRQPLHQATTEAFGRLEKLLIAGQDLSDVILDSGCGTGASTRALAALYPDSLLIGVDRSADRLGRTGHTNFPVREGNIIWLRADLPSFWVLAARAGWKLKKHQLLYPNPYPKALHLQRRWHGHPVFPTMLYLAGELELRSNWFTYLEEFATAVELLTAYRPVTETISRIDSASRFEEKYHRSGQVLYRLTVPAGVLDRWRAEGQFAARVSLTPPVDPVAS